MSVIVVDDDIAQATLRNCRYCGHEAHRPGKCSRDNCGDDEISNSHAICSDKGRVVTEQLFTRGEVSTLPMTRIRARKTGWD